jgi:hypothetical protein
VFIEKVSANFFTLTMMEEALNTCEDHHVITDNSAWNDVLGKRERSSGDQRARFIATSSPADMHGLTDLELAVSDRLAVMGNCLLHVPGSAAHWTLPRIIANRDNYS